ncbi:ABC transporter permease [Polyangium spumosum]|uniref:ABC transporter permease subunit n=1 Tax=Polyangium spumosum TaxID=889282 RepID=A0A6N7PT73_9BACT|nr:ABC transporter permease [Polyangium spumosum]MRG95183.1 ABC transporter permease subunit [Polyangium spumosum]
MDTAPAAKASDQAITPPKRRALLFLVLPPALWLVCFLVIPYLSLFFQSFLSTNDIGDVVLEPTLDPWKSFFTKDLYRDTLLYTFKIAAMVTALAVLCSVPLAYFIAFKVRRYKELLYSLIIVPLWVSYIVRAYAWKIILGREGILNSALQWAKITDAPVEAFLYSEWAIILGLVHIYTPFVLMPVYTAFEQIPRPLVEASKDLGAGRLTTFFRIVLPLSLPGLIAGGTFAFVLTLGDFLAPVLLGGTNNLMISNVVQNLFGTSNDRPLGSVVGIVLLVVVVLLLESTSRAERAFASLETGRGRFGGAR